MLDTFQGYTAELAQVLQETENSNNADDKCYAGEQSVENHKEENEDDMDQ